MSATTVRWTHAFIDRPLGRLGPAHDFWTAATDTELSELRGDRGEFTTLLSSGADACVKVQGVEDGPGGAHLDFSVEDVPAFVESALRLGADSVAEHDGWAVLRSPAGQLFCAVPWHGESVRPPVVAGTRLDQVSLDIGPGSYEAELAFWSALLPDWASLAGRSPSSMSSSPRPACRSAFCSSVSARTVPRPPISTWPARTSARPSWRTSASARPSSPRAGTGR